MLRRLNDDEAVVSDKFAASHDLDARRQLRLLSQSGRTPKFTVAGEFESKLGVFGSVLITQPVIAREFDQRQDTIDFVEPEPGADAASVQAILTRGAEVAFPIAEVLNQGELKESREAQVDTLVNLFYALLALAIVISLFGIANTLALSIHERTPGARDAARDRDVAAPGADDDPLRVGDHGADRGDPRDGAGGDLRGPDRPAAEEEGFTLSYPIGSLVVLLVLAALAGVIAAILPARRASRLDVLESLQYE